MAGIFSVMNRPGVPELSRTLNPSFVSGVIVRKQLGLSTNAQLLALINSELGTSGPLDAQAQSEFLSLMTWMDAATGVTNKGARMAIMRDIWSLYEQSKPDGTPWLTEAEARTAFTAAGVVFS